MPSSDPLNKEPISQWLRRELKDLPTTRVVEVGPGSGDIGKIVADVLPNARRDAVEIFEPYVEQYALRDIYHDVRVADAQDLPDSFFRGADVVLWIDGPEHLEYEDGLRQLERLAGLARKGVLANTPRHEYPQGAVGGNVAETHRCTWDREKWLETGADLVWQSEVTHMYWFRGRHGTGQYGKTLSVAYIVGDGESKDHLLTLSLFQSGAVADEIVVVDSSPDGAVERIVKDAYRSIDAETNYLRRSWNGSFSDARNAMLDACTKDWVLVLDADELIADEFIAAWPDCAKACLLAYSLPTYNHVRPTAGAMGIHKLHGWYPDPHYRLLRNDSRIRYFGQIHEQPGLDCGPWPSGSLGHLPHHIHHFGWCRDESILIPKVANRLRHEVEAGLRAKQDWDPAAVLRNEAWEDYQPFAGVYPALFDEAALAIKEQ